MRPSDTKTTIKRICAGAFMLTVALLFGPCMHRMYLRSIRPVAPVRITDFSARPVNKPLIEAISKGDVAQVKRLLDGGASPNSIYDPTNDAAHAALEIAADRGNIQIVRLLLDHGADVNGPNFWGGTALVSAALEGQPEIVKLLLQRGADVDADDDGVTAIGYARHHLQESKDSAERQRYTETVQLLEQAGASEWPWPF